MKESFACKYMCSYCKGLIMSSCGRDVRDSQPSEVIKTVSLRPQPPSCPDSSLTIKLKRNVIPGCRTRELPLKIIVLFISVVSIHVGRYVAPRL